MPSTTPEVNQERDELDDLIYTPKSGAVSPILSPPPWLIDIHQLFHQHE